MSNANKLGLTKEELDDVIPRILQGDQDAFQIFYDEYKVMVYDRACRYINILNRITHGMMDKDDIISEIWEFILLRLPNYDSERAAMSTFIYIVCRSYIDRTVRYYQTLSRSPQSQLLELDRPIDEAADGREITLLSLLADPVNIIKNVETEIQMFEYVFFLRHIVEELDNTKRLAFMHQLLGMTLEQSGDLIGLTRERIRQIRLAIQRKVYVLYDKMESIDPKEADQFGVLLVSSFGDDELSEETGCSLATIKICREALRLAELYDVTGGAAS